MDKPVTSDQVVARFLQLVGAGSIGDVTMLLDQIPALVNAVGPHPFWGGRPQALHLAIEGKRRDMFDLLIARGADVSGVNDGYDHWSPLMLAITRQQDGMRDELLRRGADVGLVEALLLARDEEVLGFLNDGLPEIHPNGGSLLAFARTPAAMDRLLALGASLEQADRWGATPVEALSRMGPAGRTLMAYLVSRGGRATAADYARLGDLDALEQVAAQAPAEIHQDSVMMAAVDFRHEGIVEWLLQKGASVHARSGAQSRHTALHSAAWNGDVRMVRRLLAAGADPAMKDEQYGGTAEDWALTSVQVTNNPACEEVAIELRGRVALPPS